MIYIVGLGYTKKEYTDGIKELFDKYPVYVRSDWHPIINELGFKYKSFDYIYDSKDTFDEVYNEIVSILLELSKKETIVYVVMGNAYVAEKTVELLIDKTETKVINSLSFVEKIINELGINPIDGLQIVDGLSDFSIDVKSNIIIAQVYSRSRASEVKLKLLEYFNDDTNIKILDSIGVEGKQKIIDCKLYQLDRADNFDHLTSVYIPKTDNRKYTINDIKYKKDDKCNYIDEDAISEKLYEILCTIECHKNMGYYDLSDIFKKIITKMWIVNLFEGFFQKTLEI